MLNNTDTKPIILILAPHSACAKINNDQDWYRSCDTNSKQGAELLNKIAMNLGYESKLFLSDKPRIDKNGNVINDYNRDKIIITDDDNNIIEKDIRKTQWRIDIKNYINEKFEENQDIIIFEIHSFPNKSTLFNSQKIGLVSTDYYKDSTNQLFNYLNNRTCYNFISDSENEKKIVRNIIYNLNNANKSQENPIENNSLNLENIIVDEICDIMQETSEISKKQIYNTGKTNIKNHFLLEFNEEIKKEDHINLIFSIFLYQIKKLTNTCCTIQCFLSNYRYVIFLIFILIFLIYFNNSYRDLGNGFRYDQPLLLGNPV